MTDDTALNYFAAAGALVAELAGRLRRDSPGEYEAINEAMKRGAFLRLQTGVGAAGVIDTSLWLVGTDGQSAEVFSFEAATVQ